MSVVSTIIGTAERVPLPDLVVRAAIQRLCSRTATRLAAHTAADDAAFAGRMMIRPIAEHTDAANSQHYEVPQSFFAQVLGPNRKYSSCFYSNDATTLQEAEEEALRQTVEHAGLADGQTILELGCGWGSLSLWIARQFPHAKVTAVSNSQSQRAYIEDIAQSRGLLNLRVVTADMNVFAPEGQFDRIVSVEMFEHMMNWRKLMTRVRAWLAPEGRFFMHIFTHRAGSYAFDRANREDWIAQHFFTGGVMPSHQLVRQYADIFASRRNGAGAARIISAPQSTGSPISMRIATRSKPPCATSMATRPICGCGAGAGSSSPPRVCSVTPTERSGASATTG